MKWMGWSDASMCSGCGRLPKPGSVGEQEWMDAPSQPSEGTGPADTWAPGLLPPEL